MDYETDELNRDYNELVKEYEKNNPDEDKHSELYKDLINVLDKKLDPEADYETAFATSLLMFEEATYCFDFKVFYAAIIICRSCIESVLFDSVTKFRAYYTESDNEDEETILSGPSATSKHKSLYDAIAKLEILTEKELNDINENIVEKGNFIAHPSERINREIRDKFSVQDPRRYALFKNDPLDSKLWPDKEVASAVLTKTRVYLEKVIIKYFSVSGTTSVVGSL